MDQDDERRKKMAYLYGLIQIETVCKAPLPSHRTHALACTSHHALNVGIGRFKPFATIKAVLGAGSALGLLGPAKAA